MAEGTSTVRPIAFVEDRDGVKHPIAGSGEGGDYSELVELINGKVSKPSTATEDRIVVFGANKTIKQSNKTLDDLAPVVHTHNDMLNRIKELEYVVGLGWKLLEEDYAFSGSNTSSPVHNYPITGEPDGIILPQDSYNLISVGDSVRLVPKPAGTTIEFTVTGKGSGPYFITTATDTKIISGTFDIYTKKAAS